MGAYDQTEMIAVLNRAGNRQAAFVNALGKGYDAGVARNPHSWSIIDPPEFTTWIQQVVK